MRTERKVGFLQIIENVRRLNCVITYTVSIFNKFYVFGNIRNILRTNDIPTVEVRFKNFRVD